MPETEHGITYPDATGHTRIWEHFQTLAETVEAALYAPVNTVSLTPASGWGSLTAVYTRFGPIVHLRVDATRTGADMKTGSGGNTSPDIEIFTGLPTELRPVVTVPGHFWRTVVQSGTASLTPNGSGAFTDGIPGGTYKGTGTAYQIRYTYALGT